MTIRDQDSEPQTDDSRRRSKSYMLSAVVFKLRGLLMVPLIILMFLCNWMDWENHVAVWTIGLAIYTTGLVLRLWAQAHLKYRLRMGHELAMTGPYVYMRNPVYVGNALLLISLAVLCELSWMVPIVCVWAAIVYYFTVRFEESRLLKRFGAAYQHYCERVPRWVPTRAGAMPTGEQSQARWVDATKVEWQCLLLVAIPVVKVLVE